MDGTPPRVFTLQLAWERQDESAADIAATLGAVSETIDLSTLLVSWNEAARDPSVPLLAPLRCVH